MREILSVIANVGITLGYVFLAAFVVPRITLRLWRTRLGGVGFFLLCGLHHLDNAAHLVLDPHAMVEHMMLNNFMLLIDVPQVICVWLFVSGLYVEVAQWGPWGEESAVLRMVVQEQIEAEASATDLAISSAERAAYDRERAELRDSIARVRRDIEK